MAVTYSSGNYHSIADAAGMTLPDSDWTWVGIIRPGSNITTGQDIFSNGVWGTTSTFNFYIVSGFLAVQIDTTLNQDITVSASTWIAAMIRRSSGTLSIHSCPMGSSSVTSSGGQAITGSYNSTGGFHFGRRQDTGANPFLGDCSDGIFIPGVALSTTDLSDIATGTAMDSTSWWSSREFHGIFSTASTENDHTNNHLITKTGTPPFVADPTQLVRFGASEWTAAGAGVASFSSNAKLATDLTASGLGAFAGAANALLPAELTASGAGGSTLETSIIAATDLTAAGVGGTSLVGDIEGTTFTMPGAGAASFDITLTSQTDLTAVGAGDADYHARTAAELTATGAGVSSFDVGITSASDLSADGAGVASFVPVPGVTLSADGAGTATLNTQFKALAVLTAAGVGESQFNGRAFTRLTAIGTSTASFISRSLITPKTQAGADMFIIAANAVQTATLAATTTATGFDVDNIATDLKSSGWRSTATTAQTITCTWGSTQTISGLGIGFSNLMAGSTVQLKAYTNSGDPSPVYDSGIMDVSFSYDAPKGFTTIGLTSYAFGGGNYFSHLFGTQSVKEVKVILVSSGNPDGYIELSNLVLGNAFTPARGASYGAQISYEDNTTAVRSDSGDAIVDKGTRNKVISFALSSLTQEDKQVLDGIIRRNGTSDPIFLSAHQNDYSAEGVVSYTILGRFKETPGIINFSYQLHNSQITVTEI